MDLLIEILKIIQELSGPALWVGGITITLLFAYKVIIVGSVYGVIKFTVQKLHDVLVKPTHEKKVIDIEGEIQGIAITNCVPALLTQIKRVRGKGTSINSDYIHLPDVNWLADAITEKMEKESNNEL